MLISAGGGRASKVTVLTQCLKVFSVNEGKLPRSLRVEDGYTHPHTGKEFMDVCVLIGNTHVGFTFLLDTNTLR